MLYIKGKIINVPKDDQKCDVVKIAKSVVKAKQDIFSEQCIRNYVSRQSVMKTENNLENLS